jgi:3-methyladenine DNA glycosylase Tag
MSACYFKKQKNKFEFYYLWKYKTTQWTIQLDAAGVYPVTYTKNTTTRNGNPVYDDATLFEFLILETFQAGLSWITILNKRENFRKAFNNFD